MADTVKVGVIGCGAISGAYLKMAPNFPILEVTALADLDTAKAQARAEEFGIGRVCSVDELLADDAIELVLNLTVPKAHVPICLAAVEAGKHVYAEKPLGISRDEGRQLVDAAAARGVRVGCAPDTFLGSGVQTARKVIDDGRIGRPVGFTAFTMGHGHETWHPNPGFYYQVGGGPMFDMGPYYLTALLNLLGPVKRIAGNATIAVPDRVISSEPKKGQAIRVETPDHICGTMEFENGAVGTIIASFATWWPVYDTRCPITVYGTEGSLRVPDPNGFDGVGQVRGKADQEWQDLEPTFVTGYGRAVGLADMAMAIRSGRKHRANGDQAFAVLDLMQGFLDASASGAAYAPAAGYERPAPMPDLPFGQLDE